MRHLQDIYTWFKEQPTPHDMVKTMRLIFTTASGEEKDLSLYAINKFDGDVAIRTGTFCDTFHRHLDNGRVLCSVTGYLMLDGGRNGHNDPRAEFHTFVIEEGVVRQIADKAEWDAIKITNLRYEKEVVFHE